MRKLRIGTRGSALALWQASFVRDRLAALRSVESEIIIIKTSGDRFQQGDVGQIGLKGVFIKELEDALLDERVDLAVHSMKDVPTELPTGLAITAVLERQDVRDSLISRDGKKLAELPPGARVGTSSLRRAAQLRRYRGDLTLQELRGNVDTRLRKLAQGQYDAIVLAKAGLDRLGWSDRVTEAIPPEISLPAVGQGAIGVESRTSAAEVTEILTALDHRETRAGVEAERALLAELQGGCQVPLGAWGRLEGGQLVLDACVLSADGTQCLRERATGPTSDAEHIGRDLARRMLDAGAGRILKLAGRNIGDS